MGTRLLSTNRNVKRAGIPTLGRGQIPRNAVPKLPSAATSTRSSDDVLTRLASLTLSCAMLVERAQIMSGERTVDRHESGVVARGRALDTFLPTPLEILDVVFGHAEGPALSGAFHCRQSARGMTPRRPLANNIDRRRGRHAVDRSLNATQC